MELWKIKVEHWSSYYVVAKDREEAVKKVREHVIKELEVEDSDVDFKVVNLELLDDDVIS